MRTKKIVAIFGCTLTAVGVFTPIASAPLTGQISLFKGGEGDGIFFLLLAAVSLALAIFSRFGGLWITGGLTLSGVAFEFYYSNSLIANARRQVIDGYPLGSDLAVIAKDAAASFRIEWGWLFLFAGSFLLLVAAWLPIRSQATVAGTQATVTRVQRLPKHATIGFAFILGALIGFAFAYQALRKSSSAVPPVSNGAEKKNTGPWLLLKNPFKNRNVLCTMDLRPDLLDGTFDFDRMISENIALYDYEQRPYPSMKALSGQIAVVVDPALMKSRSHGIQDYPSPWGIWKVEPLGTLRGTNAVDGAMQVPLIKFWGYYEEHRPGRQPEIGDIWMVTETAKLDTQNRVSDGRPYIEEGPTLAVGTRVMIENISYANGYEEDLVQVLTGDHKGVHVVVRGKYLTYAGR